MALETEIKSGKLKMRLKSLRQELIRLKIDGFIIPRTDEHQGEYVAPTSERLAWLTGFTGSAGVAIVLTGKAVLFIDGRYTLQAKAQVSEDLITHYPLSTNSQAKWISENLVLAPVHTQK